MEIKIRGLGHDICLHDINPKSTHLSHLQSCVESKTNLPSSYQRIICNGKTIYPPSTSSPDNDDKDDVDETIEEIFTRFKIRFKSSSDNYNKMKMILMHNASYSKAKTHIESITKLSHELETFEKEYEQLVKSDGSDNNSNGNGNGNNKDVKEKLKMIQHMIIEISCKLDSIDVSTSTSLRNMRKTILQRIDNLEKQLAATVSVDDE